MNPHQQACIILARFELYQLWGSIRLFAKAMMNVLIDKKSLQVIQHSKQKDSTPEGRIGTFLMILRNVGFNPIEGDICDIKKEQHNFRGVVSLTRFNLPDKRMGYSDDELKILRDTELIDFIAIFANHPPNLTKESNRIAQSYGIEILSEFWPNHYKIGHYTQINTDNCNVIINNCCKIRCDKEEYSRIGNLGDFNKYFTCYCKKEKLPTALFVADSGFLCESNSNTPGPGLIDKSDNIKFIRHWFKKLKNECEKQG